MTISISMNYGSYNFANPAQKQWQLSLRTPFGNVSQRFDEEPYIGDCVEDALEVIAERLESYWISTGREEDRKIIANIRANLPACEIEWAQQKVAAAKAQLEKAEKMLRRAEAMKEEAEEEAA